MTCYKEINGRKVKAMCDGVRERLLPDELIAAHGPLAGDVIAALTKAIGIPPCGACEKRRQWLNQAHQWLRDRLGSG